MSAYVSDANLPELALVDSSEQKNILVKKNGSLNRPKNLGDVPHGIPLKTHGIFLCSPTPSAPVTFHGIVWDDVVCGRCELRQGPLSRMQWEARAGNWESYGRSPRDEGNFEGHLSRGIGYICLV